MQDSRETSYRNRQEDEVEVLESIFGDDFEDVRKKDKWKVPRPPEILLHLRPLVSMSENHEVHASVTLRAKLPANYPDEIPDLCLENIKGLSDEVANDLSKQLKEKANESLEEVMMLDLSQLVQEVLHKYNKPALSIYEENMKFKNEQREKEKRKIAELQKRKQDNQRREIEEERNRRKEEERNLKLDRLRKRDKSAESRNGREHLDSGGSTGFDISQSPSVPVTKVTFNTKAQRVVYRGKCIGKRSDGRFVHIGIEEESGNPVSIQEWIIPLPGSKKLKTKADQSRISKYMKIIKAAEHEIHSLMKLSHVNLISYLAIRYVEENDHIQVDILQEYAAGTSLGTRIDGNEQLSLAEVRSITEEILLGLDYLHCHSAVHKNLKASCVVTDSRGIIRLADYSIIKHLADLFKESHIQQPGVTFVDDTIPSKNSKKGDILNLGMLVLSMIQGEHIKHYPPDIPSKLPSVFKDFLNKCLAVEDRVRMTASQLLEHAFLKAVISEGPDPSSDVRLASCTNGAAEDSSCDSDAPDRLGKDPTIYPMLPQMLSRLHSEFEELQWLGKGGFGDVVQVKNKVDGRFYAIKRILLDPRRSQFNKKITREVKLLSRLNHENVVRYYNSWIETLLNADETSTEATSSIQSTSKTSEALINSLGMIDDIENNAPPPTTHSYSDWASFDNYSFKQDESDEDDDENELFADMFQPPEEEEESVLFDNDGNSPHSGVNREDPRSSDALAVTETTESSLGDIPKRYLYIQMEFCEKNTLREAINEGLGDKRMWCLFREILDGLVHIHDQGMIHRDLKPQNIFLDKHNHIKIGDFGLATSHTVGMIESSILLDLASSKSEGGDSAMTGRVGTALYVAPELNKVGSRMSYDQKVDIYSLGIIFFEMCYKSLQTKMERVKVLGNLRLEGIKFPDNFNEAEKHKEAEIIKWCLKHAPEKRPTADELLKSSLLPALQIEKGNSILKYVRQALKDPHSTQQRQLMQQLFSQSDKKKDDVFYDVDLHKGQFFASQYLMQEKVHSTVISLMKKHGAIKVNPPLLLPRQQIIGEDSIDPEYEKIYDTPMAATFMDSCGTIVNLPYDLRMPFARYVSRNGITNLKRYAIEKVYRKAKIHRSHPRELWECAFDIVTPTVCNLIPEAEGISLVSEIISAFPALTQRPYKITVNHTSLLHAIFEHSGVPVSKHEEIKRALAEAKSEKMGKTQLEASLLDLSLSSQQVSTLFTFIYQQGSIEKIQTLLKNWTRNKHSQISMLARQGLHELNALRKNLESFSVRLPVVVHLGFVHNLHQFSGVLFQISAEIVKKKKTSNEVIAAGGRYDELIQHLAIPPLNHAAASVNHDDSAANSRKQCAFGVSIAVDKIVALMLSEHQHGLQSMTNASDSASQTSTNLLSNVDVLVAVVGRNQLFHECIRILKMLWNAGIRAEMTVEGSGTDADSIEEIQEIATKHSIAHVVILKDRGNSVKVRSFDPVHGFIKHQEKTLETEKLAEHILRKMKGPDESSSTLRHSGDYCGSSASNSSDSPQAGSGPTASHGSRRLNIEVLPPDKISFNTKKRYELQASTKLMQLPIFQHISGKAEIYGLAVDLPAGPLKTFVQGLEMGKEEEFNTSVATVTSQLPKYKKYFSAIAEMICQARFQKEVALIILYSCKDDIYRLLS